MTVPFIPFFVETADKVEENEYRCILFNTSPLMSQSITLGALHEEEH